MLSECVSSRSRSLKVCTLVVPQRRNRLTLLRNSNDAGAEGGTRTPTGYPTRPSNVRVYQFRHFGSFSKVVKESAEVEHFISHQRHTRAARIDFAPTSL